MNRVLALAILLVVTQSAVNAMGRAGEVDFVRDVRPILQRHCHSCHGATQQKSGLRLDIKSEAFRGGDNYGPSLIEGNSAESPLIDLVSSDDDDLRMPPERESLSAAEIGTLTKWIDEGALWPDGVDLAMLEDRLDHWSFKPLALPKIPAVRNGNWARNDVDRFVLSRLEREGLSPAAQADAVMWLRRVTLDLTGLPPTLQEVAEFLYETDKGETNTGEVAYTAVVDRLLKSPRYGERWAQHWLDVVRFADTHGFEVNTERPNAWPYRDYVIAAFNADTPYDRFIREQIVGDAMGQDAATGFLVTASVLLPGQIGKDAASIRLARQDSLDEIVNNIGQTFLGLSIGCARCHDHKFDPISAKDYYSMQAFVAGVEYADRKMRSPEAEKSKKEAVRLRQRVAEIDAMLTAGMPSDEARDANLLLEEKQQLETKIQAAERRQMAFAGNFRKPDDIHLLNRGDPEQPLERVAPAVLSAIDDMALPTETLEQERRRVLADWIAGPENPMTARVMTNRIWQGHFGAGLVGTPSDFGRNGLQPSHPDLLDWLAREFIRSGWSIKQMHRLIVLSATYRQSNEHNADAVEKDADGRLLWRFPSRRLEAEAIRDCMLAVSGQLNLTMGGPGFNLFNRRGGLSGFTPVESFAGDGLRRMIYAHKVRRERDAVFGAFDCPDAGQSTARRIESTTPIQALNLFNSHFTIEQSDAFAERVQAESGDDVSDQVRRVYAIGLNREPDSDELGDAVTVVREYGLATLCRALFNSNEFLFIP